MAKGYRRYAGTALVLLSAVAGAKAIDGTHINGRAVSAQWRMGTLNWEVLCCECWDLSEKGSIVAYEIRNGVVASHDTIHKRTDGFAMAPRLDITGTKVAFYHCATGGALSGSGCTTNGTKGHIAVMDFDGGNLRDLCEIPSADPHGENYTGMDWPAGNWIYYVRPRSANVLPSRTIFRVNAMTGENQFVMDYEGGATANGLPDTTHEFIRRFTMTIDGKYAAVQGFGSYDWEYGVDMATNHVFDFAQAVAQPRGLRNARDAQIGGLPGCNAAVSCGGTLLGSYLYAPHGEVLLNAVDYVNKSCHGTGSVSVACSGQPNVNSWWEQNVFTCNVSGGEGIHWAVNSEKWVLQQIGWCGHASNIGFGANQLAINWKDKAAILISSNPKPTCGSVPDGTLRTGNCPGDLWIDGGTEAAGKWEDSSGVWHTIPGYDTTPSIADVLGRASRARVVVSPEPGAVRIALPHAGQWRVDFMDSKGRISQARRTRGSTMRVATDGLTTGLYVVRISSGEWIFCRTVMVSR